MAQETVTNEELGKQLEREDALLEEFGRSIMLVRLGQRFPLIPEPADFITDIYGDEEIDEPDGITWTETHLVIQGLPKDRTLEGNLYIEEDVEAVVPPVPTLDGRHSRKPLIFYIQVDNVPKYLVSRLGCRLYYRGRDGEENFMELKGDLKADENGYFLQFSRERGVSQDENPWQISVSQQKKKIINAAKAAGLEAEFYWREPQRRLQPLSEE